jgi:hypothetical protein
MPLINVKRNQSRVTPLKVKLPRHKFGLQQMYDQLAGVVDSESRFIFQNPDHTPQDVVVAWEKSAADYIRFLVAACAFLNDVSGAGHTWLPAGYSYTINDDGTVAIHVA